MGESWDIKQGLEVSRSAAGVAATGRKCRAGLLDYVKDRYGKV